MPQQLYPWQRYLYPREFSYALDSQGFLADPEQVWSVNHDMLIRPETILTQKCAVILGEQGIGKSTVINAVHSSCAAQQPNAMVMLLGLVNMGEGVTFNRTFFQSDALITWKKGRSHLFLFLDSFDEGWRNMRLLPSLLVRELLKLPLPRVNLYITCRASQWLVEFEQRLKNLWDGDKLTVYGIAPLRKTDVIQAAQINRIDTEQFIGTIIGRNLVPFAIKPITLIGLINAVSGTENSTKES